MSPQWIATLGIVLLTANTVGCSNLNNNKTISAPNPGATANTTPIDEPGRVYLADRQLSFVPPEGFIAMTADEIKQQYPSSNPPNYVFTNPDRTASIAISFTPQALSLKQLPELQKLMSQHMEKTVPGIKWVQRDYMAINGGSWVKLEAKAKKQQANLHSDMYFTAFNDRMLGINFSANVDQYSSVKDRFTKSRDSIQMAPATL
jgi:hypothetical protein